MDVDSEENEVDLTGGDETDKIDFIPSQVLKAKATSYVWEFFIFKGSKATGPDRNKVFCKLCEKGKKHNAGLKYISAMTNMADHLKRHHKKEHEAAIAKNNNSISEKDHQPTISGYFGGSVVQKWPKTGIKWKKTTQSLTKFVVKDVRPTYLVEGEGFRDFMKEVAPQYEVPGKQTITNNMEKLYDEKKGKIVKELSDGGAASNASSYQDTNVHFITESMELKSYVLSVKESKETHSAINYRKNTDNVAEEFGITEKIVKTVTDNEPKMNAAYSKEERTGCISHIQHKSWEKASKNVKPVDNLILKMRKIGRKHNKSYKMKYGLQKAQKKRNLKVKPIQQDVQNRWGSTRVATASYLDEEEDGDDTESRSDIFNDDFKNCDAINEALRGLSWKSSKRKGKKAKEKLEEYILTRSDMQKMKNLNKFQTTIDIYSTTLGGDRFVTSSVALPVLKSMNKLLKPDDEDPSYIMELKELMLDDFKSRCADNIDGSFLFKATALDPRFKNLKVVDGKENRDAGFEELEAEAKALHDVIEPVDNEGPRMKKPRKLCLDFDQSDDDDEEHDIVKREIESYRLEPMLGQEDDALLWWKNKKNQYPHLARLVRKYLCVPATSTPAERVFSGLGVLLTKLRLAMTGDHVDMQLFLRDKL